MDKNQVLLQQAADALQELDDARKEAIKPYQQADLLPIHQSTQTRVLQINLQLDRILSIAIPISSLYAAQYYNEPHRHRRVSEHMRACRGHAYVLIEAAVDLDRDTQFRNPVATTKRLLKAIKALELAQHGISGTPTPDSVCQTAIDDSPSLCTEHYLRPRYPYEDQRAAVRLRDYLSYGEMSSVIVEKFAVSKVRKAIVVHAFTNAIHPVT